MPSIQGGQQRIKGLVPAMPLQQLNLQGMNTVSFACTLDDASPFKFTGTIHEVTVGRTLAGVSGFRCPGRG